MIFKVVSNPGHPMILWYGKTQLHLAELILCFTYQFSTEVQLDLLSSLLLLLTCVSNYKAN